MGAKRQSCRAVEMFPNCTLTDIAGRSDPRIGANEYEQHMGYLDTNHGYIKSRGSREEHRKLLKIVDTAVERYICICAPRIRPLEALKQEQEETSSKIKEPCKLDWTDRS